MVETKESISPAKITFLSIDGIVRDSDRNQEFTVKTRELRSQRILCVFNSLTDHLAATGYRWVAIPQNLRTSRPIIPVKRARPGYFQQMTEEQAQSIHFLPKLPLVDLFILPDLLQPVPARYRIMRLQAGSGMVVNKPLNMPAIPGVGSFRYTEKLKYIDVTYLKLFYTGINRLWSGIHGGNCSLHANRCSENIYKTLCRILQYLCVLHIPIFERVT